MYRKELTYLEEWWNQSPRKPLIIRGARQVGKSTLVRLFAEAKGLQLCEINLDRYPQLDRIFASYNTQKIIAELESIPKVPEINERSLLFLDEIQGVEHALPALRYLYEDRPDLPVIAAGSLLEFLLRDHTFSMPVGRIQYLPMGPLVFSEFLKALGEDRLLDRFHSIRLSEDIGDIAHSRFLELLRMYLFVGGMPEAVDKFAKTRSHRQVSSLHRALIQTYQDDFPKYMGSRDLARLLKVFAYSARSVGTKVKYSNFSSDHQSSTIKSDLELLCLARILNKVSHSHCNGLPLEADREEKIFKLLFLDVGIMNAVLGLNWSDISESPDVKLVNEGAVAEQFVGQHLLDAQLQTQLSGLNYWLREGKGVNSEVDYICAIEGHIVPVEVKAGASGSLRSLHQFMGEKKIKLAVRLDLNPPSLQQIETKIQTKRGTEEVSYRLLSMPLYLVEKIPEMVRAASAL